MTVRGDAGAKLGTRTCHRSSFTSRHAGRLLQCLQSLALPVGLPWPSALTCPHTGCWRCLTGDASATSHVWLTLEM